MQAIIHNLLACKSAKSPAFCVFEYKSPQNNISITYCNIFALLVHCRRDEDIVKFEQYKQMYDLYNRTYGFAPPQGNVIGGQTPPQGGPPPAPPGTMPLTSPSERTSSPSKRRSPSPHRRRYVTLHYRNRSKLFSKLKICMYKQRGA